jgi:hypothetical protein
MATSKKVKVRVLVGTHVTGEGKDGQPATVLKPGMEGEIPEEEYIANREKFEAL